MYRLSQDVAWCCKRWIPAAGQYQCRVAAWGMDHHGSLSGGRVSISKLAHSAGILFSLSFSKPPKVGFGASKDGKDGRLQGPPEMGPSRLVPTK